VLHCLDDTYIGGKGLVWACAKVLKYYERGVHFLGKNETNFPQEGHILSCEKKNDSLKTNFRRARMLREWGGGGGEGKKKSKPTKPASVFTSKKGGWFSARTHKGGGG